MESNFLDEDIDLHDKLVLIPIREQMQPSPMMEFYAKFRIGFLNVELQMIQSKMLIIGKRQRARLRRNSPEMLKDYLLVMNIGKKGWCMGGYDNYDKATVMFKDVMYKLKYGYSVEFIDMGKQQKPIRLGYKGVDFMW